jgi:mono/diheme cytochrome c family protein
MTIMRASTLALAAALAAALAGCRGGISEKPPIHPVLDMDFQPKLKAQSESKFPGWTDRRGMRPPVAGTVARPNARDAERFPALARFKNADDSYVASNPLPKTEAVLARGRERYNITCAACHGRTGLEGLVARRWPVPVPKISQDERIAALPDGQIYETISTGRSTMPGYGHQIHPYDRWAIVHYLRALQLHMKN